MKKYIECPFPRLFPSQLEKDDNFYMQLAYNESISAWEQDEVPIGAVIVDKQGEVIASAYNQTRKCNDPTAHAEMLAITMATQKIGDWRMNECKMYVTKEPCPMCAGAAVVGRLKEVYYAYKDPKMGGLGGAISLHELPQSNHKPIVNIGVMEKECLQMMQTFFQLRRIKQK
ncbi:nucleoside deaminase [Opitutales bacterium]|nr:nucleoside deaminase [Opitutales bacterium]MDA8990524.1 nucleoside deaminase [Opitutales bacterium]